MKAGVRKTLPTNAWYVIYPINNLWQTKNIYNWL
jgi:hypothetical protein